MEKQLVCKQEFASQLNFCVRFQSAYSSSAANTCITYGPKCTTLSGTPPFSDTSLPQAGLWGMYGKKSNQCKCLHAWITRCTHVMQTKGPQNPDMSSISRAAQQVASSTADCSVKPGTPVTLSTFSCFGFAHKKPCSNVKADWDNCSNAVLSVGVCWLQIDHL